MIDSSKPSSSWVRAPSTLARSELFRADQARTHCEANKTRCLVHCARGRSRSATIILSWLVSRGGLSLHDAYLLVKRRRPIIGPHGVRQVLMLFRIS
jgi:protein-tyrosine phosphatase